MSPLRSGSDLKIKNQSNWLSCFGIREFASQSLLNWSCKDAFVSCNASTQGRWQTHFRFGLSLIPKKERRSQTHFSPEIFLPSKRAARGQHQPHIHAPTHRPRVVNFQSDRRRTQPEITQLSTNTAPVHARRMQQRRKHFLTVPSTSSPNMCVGVLRGCPMRLERRVQRRMRVHRAAPKIAELRLRICAFFVHMVRRLRCVGCVSDFEMTVNFRRVTTHIFGTRIAVPDPSISRSYSPPSLAVLNRRKSILTSLPATAEISRFLLCLRTQKNAFILVLFGLLINSGFF